MKANFWVNVNSNIINEKSWHDLGSRPGGSEFSKHWKLHWSGQTKTGPLPPFLHSQNRRGDLYGVTSTDWCAQRISRFFSFFNNHILWTKRKEKQNNQQQKQPTQETAFNMHYPRNTVEKKREKKRQENKANIDFSTCHTVPWASFLSQKATYFTSFCSNKNN